MTKRSFIIVFSLIILAAILFYLNKNSSDKNNMLEVKPVAFQTSSGWGYNILVDHKIFIHQQYIPVIEGKQSFLNEKDALKTAALVIQKLIQTKRATITAADIAMLKLTY